jgi:hypothetical protein
MEHDRCTNFHSMRFIRLGFVVGPVVSEQVCDLKSI